MHRLSPRGFPAMVGSWALGSLLLLGWPVLGGIAHAERVVGGSGRLISSPAGAAGGSVALSAAPQTLPLSTVTIGIQPSPGELPQDYGQQRFSREADVPLDLPASPGMGTYVSFWHASNIGYRPLYFEDVNLERYGYRQPHLQPLISAAHFFGRIPALPYFIGVRHPRDCVYPLGFAQPGDCTPRHHYWVPWSTKGALLQGAAVTGLVFLIP